MESNAGKLTSSRPRRRLRDRIIDRQGTDNETLASQHPLQNHLLLCDDDLRETALALGSIEQYLSRALATLERRDLSPEELERLARDLDVESQVAALDETLTSLKHRLHVIAHRMR